MRDYYCRVIGGVHPSRRFSHSCGGDETMRLIKKAIILTIIAALLLAVAS